MKKYFLLGLTSLVLFACGNSSEDNLPNDSEMVSVYSNEHTLMHNMEGVQLSLDYEVVKITEEVVNSSSIDLQPSDFLLEIKGTIQNDFDRTIYYTPDFTLEASTQDVLEKVSSSVETKQMTIESGEQATFTTVYVIPKELYGKIDDLTFHVPAAFKEPDSKDSGDALGDSTHWQIPIK